MRRLLVLCLALVAVAFGPQARADHCQGDLYCDEPPRLCDQGGGLRYYCSPGDLTVDETLLR